MVGESDSRAESSSWLIGDGEVRRNGCGQEEFLFSGSQHRYLKFVGFGDEVRDDSGPSKLLDLMGISRTSYPSSRPENPKLQPPFILHQSVNTLQPPQPKKKTHSPDTTSPAHHLPKLKPKTIIRCGRGRGNSNHHLIIYSPTRTRSLPIHHSIATTNQTANHPYTTTTCQIRHYPHHSPSIATVTILLTNHHHPLLIHNPFTTVPATRIQRGKATAIEAETAAAVELGAAHGGFR
ncbi:hypothetical protein Droror1_Dr00020187 [Drosera rotundifolia]